ncbi:hypothetical protein Tco_0261974 [Tanacetum coccineum]
MTIYQKFLWLTTTALIANCRLGEYVKTFEAWLVDGGSLVESWHEMVELVKHGSEACEDACVVAHIIHNEAPFPAIYSQGLTVRNPNSQLLDKSFLALLSEVTFCLSDMEGEVGVC